VSTFLMQQLRPRHVFIVSDDRGERERERERREGGREGG
jgi:hypothetical protein